MAKQRVLICDNEEPLRALARAALEEGDYDVHEARDGDEALDVARLIEPDLIVLDMMMPGRTGLEVLTDLRREHRFAETPVIMLTARAQATDREAAEDAGADCFLAKPFSPLELAATADELLGAGAKDQGCSTEA
jgi:two-component system, OmpR family, response regulator